VLMVSENDEDDEDKLINFHDGDAQIKNIIKK